MTWRTLLSLFVGSLLVSACGPTEPDGYIPPEEADSELSDLAAIFDGAPPNSTLPDDNKADAVYPLQFDLIETQSPVKSQGRRGTCTIFASTALMEHLYLAAGETSVDFSEQYLQWSVKNQVGSFPNSGGSNAYSNLRAISGYGIPEESYWPYETTQWNESNDPECAGKENLPTKCYTNGDPPQTARDAELFTLPRGRWLNTNSIKAHLTEKRQGVVVGVEFFYQSWNHRLSELPKNDSYWKAGYVTAPNSEDRVKSREKPAGHGILLIGWDDELEVPMRDGTGELVVDAEGNPMKEKGFYLFKNSWGTSSFGIENEFGAGYGWISMDYIDEFATAYVSGLPDLEIPVEICGDGLDNDNNGLFDCDDSVCASTPACQAPPVTDTITFSSDPELPIPDNDDVGVSDTISVTDTGTVYGVTITVAISHTYQGDLSVVLEHDGKRATLHDRAGGGADDLVAEFTTTVFDGGPVAGDWTLRVADHARADTGTLSGWVLDIERAQ